MRTLVLVALAAILGGCVPATTGTASPTQRSIATLPGLATAAPSVTPSLALSTAPTTAAAATSPATATANAPAPTPPPATTLTRTSTPQTPAPTVNTPAPTPPPTVAPTAPPARTIFTLLPPGASLPSDAQCASLVTREPFEPRPENRTANQSNAWANGFRLTGSYLASMAAGYESRVTGNFTGTTDEIIRWGACKWGFDENDVRAQAVIESYWRQSTLGDCGVPTQAQTGGCASVGLLQVKGADIPATHPGTWPAAMTSTAFNVDYTLAVRRLCYDGKETWLRDFNATYGAGDVWGCIGRWFSGRWHDGPSETYIARVRDTLNARTWAGAGF